MTTTSSTATSTVSMPSSRWFCLKLFLLLQCAGSEDLYWGINVESDLDWYQLDWLQCGEESKWCLANQFCTYNNGDRNSSLCGRCPASIEDCNHLNLTSKALVECRELCDFSQVGEACSLFDDDDDQGNTACVLQESYCHFQDEQEELGVCKPCPSNVTKCLDNAEERTQWSCLTCKPVCYSVGQVEIDNQRVVPGISLFGSPALSASGPLADCTNLFLRDGNNQVCPEANNSICLMNAGQRGHTSNNFLNAVQKCEASGGIGALLYDTTIDELTDEYGGYVYYTKTSIPSAAIPNTYSNLLDDPQRVHTATITSLMEYCRQAPLCSESLPCLGPQRDGYCFRGFCRDCPRTDEGELDPFGCFFVYSRDYREDEIDYGQEEISSCATTCGASLKFQNCKFCPSQVTGMEFGNVVDFAESGQQCLFCPNHDVLYPDRIVPMFGVKCWQVDDFFGTVRLPKDSDNCKLAQMMNYICGCAGPGYGGADTSTKKALLAWLPRVSAILSALGSSFIIFDVSRTQSKRLRIINQLMVGLSAFDMVGACSYVLTTLPIPTTDYIYGAHGNEASCTAQGFFIQIGTISCYLNVSLAAYYYLIIKLGWSERRVKRYRMWLFACPIVVGLAFACAGIPFYDNLVLWCNNSSNWWPDVPVAVAIAIATLLMSLVCYHVYRQETVSKKWRVSSARSMMSRQGSGLHRTNSGGTSGKSLSSRVFWQAFWYLMAFYLTWLPYLALQYSWASKRSFTNYALLLAAGIMAPLQGFWNFLVFLRPKFFRARTTTSLRPATPDNRPLAQTPRESSNASSFLSRFLRGSVNKNSDTAEDSQPLPPMERCHSDRRATSGETAKIEELLYKGGRSAHATLMSQPRGLLPRPASSGANDGPSSFAEEGSSALEEAAELAGADTDVQLRAQLSDGDGDISAPLVNTNYDNGESANVIDATDRDAPHGDDTIGEDRATTRTNSSQHDAASTQELENQVRRYFNKGLTGDGTDKLKQDASLYSQQHNR